MNMRERLELAERQVEHKDLEIQKLRETIIQLNRDHDAYVNELKQAVVSADAEIAKQKAQSDSWYKSYSHESAQNKRATETVKIMYPELSDVSLDASSALSFVLMKMNQMLIENRKG